MYVIDRETLCFLEVNAAAIQQYGYSREEFLRMRVTDIRPAEDVPRLLESIQSYRELVASRGHWRHRRKSGVVFDVEVTTQSIRFAGRVAVLAVGLDVTERRAAEEKVAERTAYLQALTENNPLGIVTVDADRRIQMCNPVFERLFGYSLAEIHDKTLDSLLAPPGQEREMIGLIDRAESGEVVRATSKRRRRDGSLVDVQILGVPLLVNGKAMGSFGMYEDITERLHAEEAQRSIEEKYRRIFENAVEGFFESTPAGHFVTVNPAMARIAGYSSPEEMIREVRDIGQQLYVEPETRKDVKRKLEEDGILEGYECHMLRKDGSKIWISMNVRALRDASGKILTHYGTAVDITERKRSDLERQVTTEITHAISATDNLDDLLRLIHRALSKVIAADNCFVALVDASGMISFPFFVDRHDSQPQPKKMERGCAAYVFRTGQPMLVSAERYRQLIESGEVELRGTPARSWLGVPLRTPAEKIGVLTVRDYDHDNAYTQRDIEFLMSIGGHIALAIERKRAEETLRENEARLRVLIEQLPAVLWTVDKDLRFTSMVGAGLARLGLKQNQLVGMSLLEYFETSDRIFIPIAAHHRAIAGEPSTFHVEWKGGSYTCHVEVLRDAAGAVQGAICTALDITDRKQLEEQFRQAQKMEAVGTLSAGIAHDFKNVLTAVEGFANLAIKHAPEKSKAKRYLDQILRAVERANELVGQILMFSHKGEDELKPIELIPIIKESMGMLRASLRPTIALKERFATEWSLVLADATQVQQIIINLATNAAYAMGRKEGTLTVELSDFTVTRRNAPVPEMTVGPYLRLTISDTGAGMDAQTVERVFDPFFTTKKRTEGTGLGLWVVHSIVKKHRGAITVRSSPGQGSAFDVFFPCVIG